MDTFHIVKGLNSKACRTGYAIAEAAGAAIIGMSPGNSYFKDKTVDTLLRYSADHFSPVRVLIAGKPAEHTYRGIGYSPARAKRKARLKANALRNRCMRSMERINGDVALIGWEEEVERDGSYLQELDAIASLYAENAGFREEARAATRTVLSDKLKEGIDSEHAIDEGVNYLLEELAFLSASPKIFAEERIAYVYHRRWRIYEDFAGGVFDGRSRDDLGFIVVR